MKAPEYLRSLADLKLGVEMDAAYDPTAREKMEALDAAIVVMTVASDLMIDAISRGSNVLQSWPDEFERVRAALGWTMPNA